MTRRDEFINGARLGVLEAVMAEETMARGNDMFLAPETLPALEHLCTLFLAKAAPLLMVVYAHGRAPHTVGFQFGKLSIDPLRYDFESHDDAVTEQLYMATIGLPELRYDTEHFLSRRQTGVFLQCVR